MADYNTFNQPRDIDQMSASDPIAGPLGDLMSMLVSARELYDLVKTKKIDAGQLPYGMTTSNDDAFLTAFAAIRTGSGITAPLEHMIFQCQKALREISNPTDD